MRLSILGVCIVMLAAGCAVRPELTPAPSAERVVGMEDAAVADAAGVRVLVRTDAWTGVPSVLPELTPLEITIENHSGRPLRIRYDHFALIAPSERRYAALPPYQIEGSFVHPGPVVTPAFPHRGFSFAPYYHPTSTGFSVWPGPFPYDAGYASRYYGLWQPPLPTPDMLEKALLEGVLTEGGHLKSGFLYFEAVDEDPSHVDFTFELINATSDERFGIIRLPFLVHHN